MFRLRRYFSVTSFIGIVAVVACLLFFYRYLAFHALKDSETRYNVALTQVFVNTLWPKYAGFIRTARDVTRTKLVGGTQLQQLQHDVMQQMKGLNVVKVKIYNLEGQTIFSTEPGQIGEDEADNAGFQGAVAGRTESEITYRHSFDAFERTIADRNLISSYVPIRASPASPVEGVFEVYSDVSSLVAKLESTQWQIAAVVLGSLTLLYFFLFLIVHRADKILQTQNELERHANREQLRHQAFHDPLTGLPNRARFTELVDRAIAHARERGNMFAVLFIDLDQFKYINDSLGHSVGDQLLQTVSERLRRLARNAREVARLGGDEFIMLVPDVERIDHAARAAAEVQRAIAAKPYRVGEREFNITPSIGISIYPEDGSDPVELIKNADAAMYHAKEMGRSNYQFFTKDMNARAFAVISLEQSMRQGLERGEFVLHYQPQIDLATGCVVASEALLRWRRPDIGMVSPAQFIAIAEETGLIVPIGDWVIREACRQNRAWRDAGLPPIRVSVNVSALQFRQADLPNKIAAVLKETGLTADALELEITESVIVHGSDATVDTMRRLKAMGLALAVDDFGTGYSSFGYLKRFPIDRLKLDQLFVRGLPRQPDDLAIATAVLALAKALNLRVLAEGVENKEQLDFLRRQGCHEAQGHYFGKPLTPPSFAPYLADAGIVRLVNGTTPVPGDGPARRRRRAKPDRSAASSTRDS